MNKSPINHLLTTAIIAVLWVVFAVLMGDTFSEGPNLADKEPAVLASQLQIIFGASALLTISICSYWYYYGSLEKVAGEIKKAKQKWNMLLIVEIILSVILTVVLIFLNLSQGIEPSWYAIYFGINALLTFIIFWITTYLMSPRTVKYIPLGR